MGQQRGHQAQQQAKQGESQQGGSTPSLSRSEDAVDTVQALLGSRAASRQLRAESPPENQSRPLHQLLQTVAPARPRVQAKPLFRGVSQEWGASASGLVIQPKLTIGVPNDKYEQEADRVAAQVVQRLHAPGAVGSQTNPTLQRETLPDEEDELQMKSILQREIDPEEEDELQRSPLLQRQGGGAVAASSDLETAIQQSRGGGQPLANSIREPMEQAFGGVDFSGVKVHTDGRSDKFNRAIQARAFTTSQDIFFRQGAYNTHTEEGKHLLAHELTHVVQQTKTTTQRQPGSSKIGKQEMHNTPNSQGLCIQAKGMDDDDIAELGELLRDDWQKYGLISEEQRKSFVKYKNQKWLWASTTLAVPEDTDLEKLDEFADFYQVYSSSESKSDVEESNKEIYDSLSLTGKKIADASIEHQKEAGSLSEDDQKDFEKLIGALIDFGLLDKKSKEIPIGGKGSSYSIPSARKVDKQVEDGREMNLYKTDYSNFEGFLRNYTIDGRQLIGEFSSKPSIKKDFPHEAFAYYQQLSYTGKLYANAVIAKFAKVDRYRYNLKGEFITEIRSKRNNKKTVYVRNKNYDGISFFKVQSLISSEQDKLKQAGSDQELDLELQAIESASTPWDIVAGFTGQLGNQWKVTVSAENIVSELVVPGTATSGGKRSALQTLLKGAKEYASEVIPTQNATLGLIKLEVGSGAGVGEGPGSVVGTTFSLFELVNSIKECESTKKHLDNLKATAADDEEVKAAQDAYDQSVANVFLLLGQSGGGAAGIGEATVEIGKVVNAMAKDAAQVSAASWQLAGTVLAEIAGGIGIATGGTVAVVSSVSAAKTTRAIKRLKRVVKAEKHDLMDDRASDIAKKAIEKKKAKLGKKITHAVTGTVGATAGGIGIAVAAGVGGVLLVTLAPALGAVAAVGALGVAEYMWVRKTYKRALHRDIGRNVVQGLIGNDVDERKKQEKYCRDVLGVPPVYITSQLDLSMWEITKEKMKARSEDDEDFNETARQIRSKKPWLTKKKLEDYRWGDNEFGTAVKNSVGAAVGKLIDIRRELTARMLYEAGNSEFDADREMYKEVMNALGCIPEVEGLRKEGKHEKAIEVISEKLASS